MKRGQVILILLLVFISSTFSQHSPANTEIAEGLQYYRNGQYEQAVINFRNVISDPDLEAIHGDAYFWLSKSYFIREEYDDVERSLETYLLNYPDHPKYSEAFYLKGRLLFMQNELEKAIQVFQTFISRYPDSSYISNAYFWVGESLFLLGNLDLSMNIFMKLLEDYPQSVKVEAANYRIYLIKTKKRENELLKLLKMSHEELLKSLEEFQKRERTYEQAISAYQKKIASSGKADISAELNSLQEQLSEKDRNLEELRQEIADLKQKLLDQISDQPPVQEPGTDLNAYLEARERLLKSKEEALNLKETLLEWSQLQ